MALHNGIQFITGVILSATISIVASENCVYSKPCTCATSNFKIDLQPLMSKIPYLTAKDSSGNFDYFINPCNVIDKCFSQGGLPPSTACQQDITVPSAWYQLGTENNSGAHGDPEKGEVVFTNSAMQASIKRDLIMNVKCSDVEGSVSTVITQGSGTGPFTYTLTLSTRFACKNPYAGSGGGLSAGSVLVILFFVFLVVYQVGGVLFLKFVRRAEGTEAIPNYEFWKDLPSLIKDGVLFTFRGCKTESTYEKI